MTGKNEKKNIFKRIFWFLLRVALAAGIITYLVVNHSDSFRKAMQNINYWYLACALLTVYFQYLVCAWRWNKLTSTLHVPLSYYEAFSLTMQGCFFSLVIPGGAIGGDVAKVGVLSARSPKGRRFEGALTILMDRIVGMAALFFLTLLVIPFSLPLIMKLNHPKIAVTDSMRILFVVVLLGMCVAGLAACFVLFFHRAFEKISIVKKLLDKLDALSHGKVARFTEAFDAYAKEYRKLLYLAFISIFLIHWILTPTLYFITLALGVPHVSWGVLTCAIILGNIAGLIPLTPAGLGLRDVTICSVLVAGGVADPAVMPVLLSAVLIVANLSGGLFFILDAKARNAAAAPVTTDPEV